MNRITNAVWHLDSTCKLVKYKFVSSVAIYRHSRHIMWLKYSNNNRGITSYNLFIESINEHIAPLQVRADKGSENRLIVKHMVIVYNT